MQLDTVPFGSTGLRVSEIAFGAARFGGKYDRTKERAFELLDAYADSGGNFIDTADYYGDGDSERWLGEWLDDRDREQFVLASKICKPVRDDPNGYGLNRKHLRRQIDRILDRLGTDYLDVLHVHRIDPETPPDEFVRTLDEFVAEGKVNYLGIVPSKLGAPSWNPNAWRVARINEIADKRHFEPLNFAQIKYNLLERDVDEQFFPMCDAYDMGTIAYSPLAEGFLTGKYAADERPDPQTRAAKENHMEDVYFSPKNFEKLAEIERMSEELDVTPAQLSLAWLLHHDRVTVPIIGPRTVDQLDENVAAADVDLSDEQFDRLTDL